MELRESQISEISMQNYSFFMISANSFEWYSLVFPCIPLEKVYKHILNFQRLVCNIERNQRCADD